MDIENIKTVLKVSEYSSINKASLSLYKTQSQVSRIVRDFENLVNTTIFDRSNKGVQVTAEGKEILGYCQRIVTLYDEMILYNTNLQSVDYRGKMNIYNSINIYSTISEILSSFSNNHPHISINYVTLHNNAIVDVLLNNEDSLSTFSQIYTDRNIPHFKIPNELVYTELLKVPIIALTKADSVYAKKYKSLSAKTLSTLPLIQFNPYSNGPSFSSTILDCMGVESPQFQYSTDDLRVLQRLLDSNAGIYIGICPSPQLFTNNIVGIPIKSNITVGYGTLIRKDNKNDLITLFNQYLIDWYKKIY